MKLSASEETALRLVRQVSPGRHGTPEAWIRSGPGLRDSEGPDLPGGVAPRKAPEARLLAGVAQLDRGETARAEIRAADLAGLTRAEVIREALARGVGPAVAEKVPAEVTR